MRAADLMTSELMTLDEVRELLRSRGLMTGASLALEGETLA